MTPEDFMKRVDRRGDDECWPWIGGKLVEGYGHTKLNGAPMNASRASYLLFVGPIPEGRFHVDHLCRNRACVNPRHLEAVTERENILRGEGPPAINARKTHCVNGHEFTPENTRLTKNGRRNCYACLRVQWRDNRKRRRARLKAEATK